MTHKLHAFTLYFTLYLNIENAQNPVWKHFEKTNTCFEQSLSVIIKNTEVKVLYCLVIEYTYFVASIQHPGFTLHLVSLESVDTW